MGRVDIITLVLQIYTNITSNISARVDSPHQYAPFIKSGGLRRPLCSSAWSWDSHDGLSMLNGPGLFPFLARGFCTCSWIPCYPPPPPPSIPRPPPPPPRPVSQLLLSGKIDTCDFVKNQYFLFDSLIHLRGWIGFNSGRAWTRIWGWGGRGGGVKGDFT